MTFLLDEDFVCLQVQQKHMEEDQLARVISQKLLERPGVSFSDIASVALEHGRKVLAVKVWLQCLHMLWLLQDKLFSLAAITYVI